MMKAIFEVVAEGVRDQRREKKGGKAAAQAS
jgi:hypothetical protein